VAAREAFGTLWVRKQAWLADYGSESSDQARMLAIALEHDLLSRDNEARLLEVSRTVTAQRYRSTQDSMAVLRLAKALAKSPPQPLAGALVVGSVREGFNTGGDFNRDLTAPDLDAGAAFTLDGGGPFYLSQDSVGAPLTAPAAETNGLDIDRDYFRMDAKAYDGAPLAEGEMLIVRLTVRAAENFVDALVTDLLPAGLEIENLNLLDAEQLEAIVIEDTSLKDAKDNSSVRFSEFRDDRYVAALTNTYDTVKLFYLVRAVTPGNYANPTPLVEDMYRPQFRGIGKLKFERIQVQGR